MALRMYVITSLKSTSLPYIMLCRYLNKLSRYFSNALCSYGKYLGKKLLKVLQYYLLRCLRQRKILRKNFENIICISPCKFNQASYPVGLGKIWIRSGPLQVARLTIASAWNARIVEEALNNFTW